MPLVLDDLSTLQGYFCSVDRTTSALVATAIPNLAFPVKPDQTWIFMVVAKIGSSSIAGTKYAISIPVAATMMVQVRGTLNTAAAENSDTITTSGILGTIFNTAGLTTAAIGAFVRMFGRVTTGVNGGTVQIMQAKVTSGIASTYAGSWIVAFRIG